MRFLTFVVLLSVYGCGGKGVPTQPEIDSFDITIIGVESLPIEGWQKVAIEQAAKRWEGIIAEGFPASKNVPDVGDLDDFLLEFQYSELYVGSTNRGQKVLAGAIPTKFRGGEKSLPFRGVVTIYGNLATYPLSNWEWESIMMHEIAHALGFSPGLRNFKGLESIRMNNRLYFLGPLAAEAYRDILFQSGKRDLSPETLVPLDNDGGHWDGRDLSWDIMSPMHFRGSVITKVTIQAMADIGYTVDVSKADTPPRSMLITKLAIGRPFFHCDGEHIHAAVQP